MTEKGKQRTTMKQQQIKKKEPLDTCIEEKEVNGKTVYKCKICEVSITYKKNIKKHLMSKRHAQGKKDNISTSDETIQVDIGTRQDTQELPFCRKTDDDESRKGRHFMIEVQKPIKYKFCKRLVKYMHICIDCKKSFQNAGLLRRHRITEEHKQMSKKFIEVPRKEKVIKIARKIYETRQRKQLEKKANLFECAAVCNEFSVSKEKFPHSHSHLYLKTKDGKLFKDVKKIMKKHFNIRANDIVRPINIRQCIKYITKQDQQSIVINIPLKYTSTIYQAQIYRDQGHTNVNWGDYIPSQIGASDRRVFEDNVKQEINIQNAECLTRRVEGLNLREWQEEVMKIAESLEGDERAVLWVVDFDGGKGKSKLSQYLAEKKRAAILHDLNYVHNSFIYAKEKYVIFDLPRGYDCKEMRLIEDLKNGIVNVQKYESKRVIFDPPVVIVFSNSLPNLALLSIDRWHVYTLQAGPLYVTRYL